MTGSVEVDSPTDELAWDEAHDGLSVYKGQWAEVILKFEKLKIEKREND